MPVTHEKQTPNKPEVGEEEKKPLHERSPLLWLFLGGIVGGLGVWLVKRFLDSAVASVEPPALPPAPPQPPPPPYGYPPPGYQYPPWWRG